MSSVVRRAVEARQADLQQARTSRMARTQVEGRVEVAGSGETRATINFPVLYAEKPIMTFGGELAGNHSPEAGNFPVISVMVLEWDTIERSDQRTYYKGCEVAIVTLGRANQRVIAHTLFEGLAFRDPAVGSTGLEETI